MSSAVGKCAYIIGRLGIRAPELRLATTGLDRGDHLCATRRAGRRSGTRLVRARPPRRRPDHARETR